VLSAIAINWQPRHYMACGGNLPTMTACAHFVFLQAEIARSTGIDRFDDCCTWDQRPIAGL
jgi:hypothetical protein